MSGTLAQVRDGVVVCFGLPNSGVLSSGETVSNYAQLPPDVLAAEGWVPLVDEPPAVEGTQLALLSGFWYDATSNAVVADYTIVSKVSA